MRVNWIKKFFDRKCGRQYQELLSPYLDCELDAPMRKRFEDHLQNCESCRTAYEEVSFASGFVSNLKLPDEVPIEFPLWLKEEKFPEKIPAKTKKFGWRVPA